jgi:hypothetical protein
MDPPPGEHDEFDKWYREEHIPSRLAVPGFAGAVRGWAVEGEPAHLVVYHIDSLDVLATTAYGKVKGNPGPRTTRMLRDVAAFTRFTGEEIGDTGARDSVRYLYLVTFAVPVEAQDEFDAWYADDHVPTLMRCADWSRIRRYAIVDSDPAGVTRAALHEIGDLASLGSPERREARESPWRARLAEKPWFGTARYAVYEVAASFSATTS